MDAELYSLLKRNKSLFCLSLPPSEGIRAVDIVSNSQTRKGDSGKKKGEAQGCEMMPHGSQNRQWQNILRSRTRETGGRQEQKGGSE